MFKKQEKEVVDRDIELIREDRAQFRAIAAQILHAYIGRNVNENDAIDIAFKTTKALYTKFKLEGK